jgi:hypothetical protein
MSESGQQHDPGSSSRPEVPSSAPPSLPAAPSGSGWQEPPPTPPAPPSGSGWQATSGGGGGSGCVKIALIIVVLAVATVTVLFLLAGNVLNNLGRGGNGIGNGDGIVGSEDCQFLSDAEAKAVLGGQADAMELAGLFDATIGLIIDKRVLPDAPDCVVTDGQRAYLARIAVAGGGTTAFAAERARAEPSSQDQGGGLSVENPGYFGGDVAGLGDEAFCTGLSDAIMAGVVVRQGDRVVYVSVGSAAEGQTVPDMNTTPDGVVTSPGLCALAQELARAVLD